MKIKLFSCLVMLLLMTMTTKAQEAFVPNAKGGLEPLKQAVIAGNKTGSSLFALYGKKITSSLVLDGRSSSTYVPRTSAIFYVLTPKTTPINAWKLVPLKSKKNNRELPYLKTSAYSGSKSDLNDIELMPIQITEDIYELRPMGDLKNGDYALVYMSNGVPALVYDFRIESNLPPYPPVSKEAILAELSSDFGSSNSSTDGDSSTAIIRWYFDSDPRGARIFYRVISHVPNEVKNTNETYLTTTPLEETKSLNIPGLTKANANDVVIEIKVTKRGYEEQVKRYNLRQVLDQQEISGFFELVQK